MGGGIGRGEATVLLGPSGIGKTLFGLRFVDQGLNQGSLPVSARNWRRAGCSGL
jgi:KaiC/GvpD/RAD55 family RecA-like ATPase